jgi:hypothetical protein
MTTIDIGTRDTRRVIIGASVAGVLGVLALVGAVSAFADGEPVGGSIAGVIGVAFTGIAVLAIVNWKKVSRPRQLVVEPPGVRWNDPDGAPWAVPWQELGGVAVSRTQERVVQLSDALTRRTMVRLDLFPRDPQRFRAAHPHMEHLWEFHNVRNGYRLPLGDAANLIPTLDHSLRQCAGPIYLGVRDEGFSVGLH